MLNALLLMTLMMPAETKSAVSLYVAPNGRDTWSGRVEAATADGGDGPLATLERARDEVRKLTGGGKTVQGPITVHLRGGDYLRDKAFELTEADSGSTEAPVTWRASEKEKVRLLGGIKVTNWRPVEDKTVRDRLDPAVREKVLQADLRAIGVKDFGEVVVAGKRLELFFADDPGPLAERGFRQDRQGDRRRTGHRARQDR